MNSLSIYPCTVTDGKGTVISPPVLVTVRSVACNDTFQPGVREIYAGCVRTMAVSQKKVCESKDLNRCLLHASYGISFDIDVFKSVFVTSPLDDWDPVTVSIHRIENALGQFIILQSKGSTIARTIVNGCQIFPLILI